MHKNGQRHGKRHKHGHGMGMDMDIKGIVQRDLTGVETRLKRSALKNNIVAKFAF
jgi:hypothetical protein